MLLIGNPEFAKALRRIEKISILINAHVVTNTLDALHIRISLTCILETFIFGKGFNAIYISELHR